MIPHPWVAVVLTLGVFRLVRLIGWDDLPWIVKARSRLTGMRVRYDPAAATGPIYSYRHPTLAHFLGCAFCQGWWVGLAVYLVWLAEPRWTLYGLAPFALNGAVGLIAKNLDP